jgi:hypothetical protein
VGKRLSPDFRFQTLRFDHQPFCPGRLSLPLIAAAGATVADGGIRFAVGIGNGRAEVRPDARGFVAVLEFAPGGKAGALVTAGLAVVDRPPRSIVEVGSVGGGKDEAVVSA